MKILSAHALVILAALLAVTPNYSIAQQRTEKVVIAPVSETSQPGVITTRQQLDDQVRRFVDSIEQLVNVVEVLPHERSVVVEQFLEGLDQQREALFTDFSTASPEAGLMLTDLRAIVESTERITSTLNTGSEPSEPVDTAEYRALTADVTQVVVELTTLVDSLSGVTDSPDEIVAVIDHIAAGQERVLDRLLVVVLIIIAFFFVWLTGYRFVTAKTTRRAH